MFTGEPCVRWPPIASDMPRKVSPGFIAAKNTAWFACEPEFGCTLAASAPKSLFTRSIASCSAMSTNSQPP